MSLLALGTVLRAAWRRPSSVEAMAVGGGLIGLTVAVVARDKPLVLNTYIVLTVALVAVAQHVVQGLLRQNHPHLARLMPGHHAALRQAFRGLLALALVATAGLWAALVPGERPVMLFVAPIVLWLSACLAMGRAAYALLLPVLSIGLLVAALELGLPKTEAIWVGIAASSALTLGLLPRLMRRGDAAHAAHWRRQRSTEALLAMSMEGGKAGALQGQGWLARLMVWWLWPTRRLVARAQTPVQGPQDALRRAQWVVNPGLHVVQQLWMLITVGLPITLLAVLPALLRSASDSAGLVLGQALFIGLPLWLLVLNLGASLTEHWSTRGEQALLRLTPGMPQGERLRQGWRRQLQVHAMAGWALHAAVALGAALWWQPAAWPHALGAVLLLAPLAYLVSRFPWGHQVAPRGVWMNWATLVAALGALVAAGPLAGGPTLWPLAPLAWLGAALLAWRWHRAARSVPWPAGHAGPLQP